MQALCILSSCVPVAPQQGIPPRVNFWLLLDVVYVLETPPAVHRFNFRRRTDWRNLLLGIIKSEDRPPKGSSTYPKTQRKTITLTCILGNWELQRKFPEHCVGGLNPRKPTDVFRIAIEERHVDKPVNRVPSSRQK